MRTSISYIKYFCFLVILNTYAQETKTDTKFFSIPLSMPNNPGKLVLKQTSGSIKVIAYDGKEVIVKVNSKGKKVHRIDGQQRNLPNHDQTNGLKQVDHPFNIHSEEKNNVVQIINNDFNTITNFDIKVPLNFSLKLSTVNAGVINIIGVNGEMEISNMHGTISLHEVSGSALIDTVDDDIKVIFNSISKDSNMAFSSLYGNIDVTFPKSLRADIKAKSDMGEILTDFDIVLDNQKPKVQNDKYSNTHKIKLDQWVNGKINGGGPEIHFRSFSGDIMIRSK